MFRTFSFPFRRAPGVTRAWGQRMLVRFIVAPMLGPRFEQLPWGPWLSVVGAGCPAVPFPAPAAASDTSPGRAHMCGLHKKLRAEVDMVQLPMSVRDELSGMWVCSSSSPCRVAPANIHVQCALHNKERTSMNMTETTPGRWECGKLSPCRGASVAKEVECALHGKKRTSSNMKETSPGRWECPTDNACP